MYFASGIYALAGFAAGLITGLILYHLISRKLYGNMENRFKSSLHDFLETEKRPDYHKETSRCIQEIHR